MKQLVLVESRVYFVMSSRRTHKEFVKQLKEVQPELTVVGEYKSLKIKILVKDSKKFRYLVFPANLLKGSPPTIQTAENKTKHVQKIIDGFNMGMKIISKVILVNNPIIVKDINGFEYNTTASYLMANKKPDIRTCTTKNLLFAFKSNNVHNNKYDYSKTEYIKDGENVNIICKQHGVFKQTPTAHLQGSGCKKCAYAENNLGTFKYSLWNKMASNSKYFDSFKVYIIKIWDDETGETFFKIGKTYTSIRKRFTIPYSYRIPYNFEVVKIIEGTNSKIISDLEIKLKQQNKEHKYNPKKKFAGHTECFSKINININN